MTNLDSYRAFVLAAELGSFSAAARRMGKAQSAISTAIANLEIDSGVELFDRSARNPVLSRAGAALLPNARGILLSNQEFVAKATSMAEGAEENLVIAVEHGISTFPLFDLLHRFSDTFPHVTLKLLSPGAAEIAPLLREDAADIGLMIEQENYPQGFQFRGVGHSKFVPVCGRNHPLSRKSKVSHADLREHRELVLQTGSGLKDDPLAYRKSTSAWHAESLLLVIDLIAAGFGWSEIPYTIARQRIKSGDLVPLKYAFQQSDILEGIDVVWTEHRTLGVAGQWMLDRLLLLPQGVWRDETE